MNREKDKKNRNEKMKIILMIIILVVLISVTAIMLFFNKKKNDDKKLAFNELIAEMNENKIEKIKMTTGSNSLTVIMKGEGS